MTSDQQEPSPAPAETSAQASANQVDVQPSPAPATATQSEARAPSTAAAGATATAQAASERSDRPSGPARPRIKIGTQREGVAAPRIPPRVATVFRTTGPDDAPPAKEAPATEPKTAEPKTSGGPPPAKHSPQKHERDERTAEEMEHSTDSLPRVDGDQEIRAADAATGETQSQTDIATLAPKPTPLTTGKGVQKLERAPRSGEKIAVPNLRAELPPELADELETSLGGMSIDQLIESENKSTSNVEQLEPEARVRGKVIQVHRDSVFVDLGGPNQGVFPVRQFAEPPAVGASVEGIVARFNAEEGLYELTVSGGAVDVGDWSQVTEGMVVEARVTGHNKGGLECDVNKLRGFIPMSQIAPYRVEQPEQFVGQGMICLVTEVDPERRKLVLSRRSMIEREQAEAKEKMLAELAPGQIREGIVRSLRDFGAFVDIGGVDGLLHVSQISWDRLKHPNEVLKEGQKIRVKIERINPETHKISLSHRDLTENPWKTAASKYAVTSVVKGTVSKLMEFGAFVRLESGIEGLIHISELAHQRVFRASDIVSEGQEVEVKVLSVDPDAQRISLSLKALQARPEPKKKAEPEPEEAPPPPPKKRSTPLKGGLGRGTGGPFGLKW